MAQIYEVESVIENAKFIDNGVLLDKFQNYPIVRGLYNVKVIKTFIDKKGNPVQVVRLVPHIHDFQRGNTCKCSCGAEQHQYIEKEYTKNSKNTYCEKKLYCKFCGEEAPIIKNVAPHKWMYLEGSKRVCKLCGAEQVIPQGAWLVLSGAVQSLEETLNDSEKTLIIKFVKGFAYWQAKREALRKGDSIYSREAEKIYNKKWDTFEGKEGISYEEKYNEIEYFINKDTLEVLKITKDYIFAGRDGEGEEITSTIIKEVSSVSPDNYPNRVLVILSLLKNPNKLNEVLQCEANIKRLTSLFWKWEEVLEKKFEIIFKDVMESYYYIDNNQKIGNGIMALKKFLDRPYI